MIRTYFALIRRLSAMIARLAPDPEPRAQDFPALRQLFVNFHQDWSLDYSDPAEVVAEFMRDSSTECLQAASTELDRLLALHLDDRALSGFLVGLGSDFAPDLNPNPRPDDKPQPGGITTTQWLNEVHDQIREFLKIG